MAINIFQGSVKRSKSSRANSASNSSRAQAAKAALVGPSVTSDSGSTAVGKTSTLSKVGNFVGKAAGIASKFLPGVGGVIAKGLANVFNDPEWWQSVPGDAVTLNAPLRDVAINSAGTARKLRYTIAEIASLPRGGYTARVIQPTTTQATQYLMPEVRKVVNAIALQSADDYSYVLATNATVYALWQQLKKFQYLLQHGQTYIANLDDIAFPLLQVENAAFLKSSIGRLEEYLRANVRLPHTLCEYLAWRFGRVYKSNTSAKSGLVMYNVVPMISSVNMVTQHISQLLAANSASAQLQQANADLYNVYYDHDMSVEIAEDSQYKFDIKEFCLRTNLDVEANTPGSDTETPDCVYVDSSMDNPTTFMASSVSTIGLDATGAVSWLFPVKKISCFVPLPKATNYSIMASNYLFCPAGYGDSTSWSFLNRVATNSIWGVTEVGRMEQNDGDAKWAAQAIGMSLACKALDIYNKDIYVRWFPGTLGFDEVSDVFDVTSLSMDLGLVPNTVLGNEHVYAFANLVYAGRKHSMSYKEAETLVSRDTANLVEKLDVAVAK